MNRFGYSTILFVALAIGATFEVAKRMEWVQAPPSAELTGIGKNGRLIPADFSEKQAAARAHYAKARPALRGQTPVSVFQKALMVPPTEGKFDSNAGQAGAGKKTAQADKKASDKNKDGTQKCRPKEDSQQAKFEFKMARAQAAPVPKNADAQQNRKNIPPAAQFGPDGRVVMAKADDKDKKEEEELPECEDETPKKVADEKPVEADESKNDHDSGTYAGGPVTFSGGLITSRPQTNQMAGLEEWKARVLHEPNFKETVRLIEAAQSGQISSELFYTLVKMMLADPRADMRELGVLAAGRTPSSQSFHLLVEVLKQESFGSKLRQRAEGEMKAYQQLNFLSILEGVMRSSDDVFAVIWATRTVEDSARRYLTVKTPTQQPPAGGGGNGGNTPPAAKNPYLSNFNRFIVVLQELSNTKGNTEQSSQAKQTLTNLQALIKAVS